MTTMHDVESSNIAAVGYDEFQKELHVRFHNATLHPERLVGRAPPGTYVYHDVPRDVFDELMRADSKGSFLNRVVKGTYKFSKLEEVAPAEEHLTLTMTRPTFIALSHLLQARNPLRLGEGDDLVSLVLCESSPGVVTLETVVHRDEGTEPQSSIVDEDRR